MTIRLYYSDSYLTDFEATVVDRAEDGRRIYLDRTAFYPTSGGQPHDTGWLGGVAVGDVVDEGERIAHLLTAPCGTERVVGRIDWTRRFDHMQQHTGQHLLSAVFEELLHLPTVSVHFGDAAPTLDLDGGGLTPEQARAVEERANALVADNRPVTVGFEDAAGAADLRKASAREGTLRIVTIRDLDRSACGGTHVSATGEIGPILLRKIERVRKTARVEFLCGRRAVGRARADYDALARLGTALSASVDEAADVVVARLGELKEATGALREAQGRLNEYRARELYQQTAERRDGGRTYVERRKEGLPDNVRGLAQAYAALPRAVFIAAMEEPPSILIAASEDSGVNAGEVIKSALAKVGGRGGGSPRIAQGTVPSREALELVLASIAR